jgi:type IV secretory pathway TrbL component
MTRAIRPTLLLLLAAAAITIALLFTGVLGGAGPTPAGAASAKQTRAHSNTAQSADTDNVQSGDQSAPDNTAGENGNESPGNETAGENGSSNEPAGEAQPGHEDPQGEQVDHQCPPSCAPGEQP